MNITPRPAHLLDSSNDSQHGVRDCKVEPGITRQNGAARTVEAVTVEEDFEMKRQPYMHVRAHTGTLGRSADLVVEHACWRYRRYHW